eukprot:TRINITY_DN13684_c0_g2_i1.p1 TRINITY_DN13684_c0_g2~~TRINITY_DN13684_c0_g2_i1.p1  ORF type:complete len:420 (+),score=136.31 TRINITY_DN13684_c0_g2_i1:94-1353(+)
MATVPRAELARHASPQDAWVAVRGVVYDVTEFAEEHPGGAGLLHGLAGGDATEDFDGMHPASYLEQYLADKVQGRLVDDAAQNPAPPAAAADESAASPAPPPPPPPAAAPPAVAVAPVPVLQRPPPRRTPSQCVVEVPGRVLLIVGSAPPDARAPFLARARRPLPAGAVRSGGAYATPPCSFPLTLSARTQLTHNTFSLRFDVPASGPGAALRLYPGQHVYLRNAAGAARPYTPVSLDAAAAVFVVKVYPGGALGEYLKALPVGQAVQAEVKAFEKFQYIERGWYTAAGGAPRWAKNVGMVCGGTGITPAYSVMKAVLDNPFDLAHLYLLFANQAPHDVLLAEQLQALEAAYPSRVHVWYTVDAAGASWAYSTGYVDAAMLRFLPLDEDDLTLVCGPPPMVRSLKALLPTVSRAPVIYL